MSASEPFVPRRWHVYLVDLEPRLGTKPGKQRPCVAIQPTEFAQAGLPSTVILPLTTKVLDRNAFPLRVRVPPGVCGLAKESEAVVDQILAWDNALFRRDLGELPEAISDDIRRAILDFLDLD